ncbi:hypothetical protein ACFX19_030026 [Malus domestica]
MEDDGGATGEMMEQLQEDDVEEDVGVVNNTEFSSSTSKSSVFLNAACAITNTTPNSQSAAPLEYSPSRGLRTATRSSPPLAQHDQNDAVVYRFFRTAPAVHRGGSKGRTRWLIMTMKTMSEIGCQSKLRNRIRSTTMA